MLDIKCCKASLEAQMVKNLPALQETQVQSLGVDDTGAYYTERSQSERKTPIQYTNTYIYGIQKDGNDNPVCETAKETQI